MATSDIALQLSGEQIRLLQQKASESGRNAQQLLDEATAEYLHTAPKPGEPKSLGERLAGDGLLGCLAGGPSDLSTNLKYIKGFRE